MKPTPARYRREQRGAVFAGLILFSFVLLILQLWMFTATLENLIDGHTSIALPAAAFSLVCFGVNVWMLIGLYRMERSG